MRCRCHEGAAHYAGRRFLYISIRQRCRANTGSSVNSADGRRVAFGGMHDGDMRYHSVDDV